jgi:peptidoglycan/xylan/chitin deacetylase (PgdA/CDA1 family)
VSLEDIIDHLRDNTTLPPKPVAFTMDDGFEDQASLAAPVFTEFNCPVTIFLITGMLDGQLWPWFCQVEYLLEHSKETIIHLEFPAGKQTFELDTPEKTRRSTGHILQAIKKMDWNAVPDILAALADATQVEIPASLPAAYKPISWDQARDLEKQGITFGPHTISHPILSRVDDRQADQEIRGSWQRLREELSSPSKVFCYPNGRLCDFGKREIELVRTIGLLGALSTVPDYAGNGDDQQDGLYMLPRFALPGVFEDFIQYCTWIEYAKQKLR